MLVKLLLKLIFGYVRIEVEGYYVERFLNICNQQKILVWNLKRKNRIKIYLNIGIKDFKRIIKISRKVNCKIKIINKKGIPFILNRYKKRKLFVILLILIISIICISTRYIWNIEIEVENDSDVPNIMNDIEEAGLTKGILKSKIKTEDIINKLKIKRNDIAWIGIDLEGTNAIVSIVKAELSPEIIDNSKYCNIIATKPGTITKIIAQNGTALVKAGDYVQKGDILIAGYMQGKYTDIRYLHSLGEVEAIVSYQKSKEQKLNENIYKITGNKENKFELKIFDKNIKLYIKESKFQKYERQIEEHNLKIGENFYLPVTFNKIKNIEQIEEEKKYTIDEAISKVEKELSEDIEEKILLKEKICNKKIETKEENEKVLVTLIVDVIENICEYQKIE